MEQSLQQEKFFPGGERWILAGTKGQTIMGKRVCNHGTEQTHPKETEVMADGTVEKGLGPADVLLQAGNLNRFQPLQ